MNHSTDKEAVALHYNGEDTPTVVATGHGDLAEEILSIAREFEVPIMENKELLSLLSMLELGEEIPRELFVVVAEIIALSYWMRGLVPDGYDEDLFSEHGEHT